MTERARAGDMTTSRLPFGARLDRWSSTRDATTSWNWRLWFWRAQVQLTVHHHEARGDCADRLVVQGHFVYDRRKR